MPGIWAIAILSTSYIIRAFVLVLPIYKPHALLIFVNEGDIAECVSSSYVDQSYVSGTPA